MSRCSVRTAFAPLVASALLLAGCVGLRNSAPADQEYALEPPMPAAVGAAGAGSLAVQLPVAGPGLDSNRIVVAREDGRLDHYAASRWSAAVPELLLPLVVEALRDAGHYQIVEAEGAPFASDYVLRIEIRRFTAEYGAGVAPDVHVVLDYTRGGAGTAPRSVRSRSSSASPRARTASAPSSPPSARRSGPRSRSWSIAPCRPRPRACPCPCPRTGARTLRANPGGPEESISPRARGPPAPRSRPAAHPPRVRR